MKFGLTSLFLFFGLALAYGQHIPPRDSLTCDTTVYVPNSFCPNCDGINDMFIPRFKKPPSEFALKLYNRWGEEIFISKDYLKGWAGTRRYENEEEPAPAGTYYWIMTFRYATGEKYQCKGSVVLIR